VVIIPTKRGTKSCWQNYEQETKCCKKQKLRNKVDYIQCTKLESVKQKKEKRKKVVDNIRERERKTIVVRRGSLVCSSMCV
jgi:hypothetical protein